MRLMRMAFLLAAISVAALLAPIYRRKREEQLRQLRKNTQVIETPAGTIEYAAVGSGEPVVLLHGAGGGYEQGLLLGTLLETGRYLQLAPSRPGYRRTPLATGATFEEQADLIAHLLDQQHIHSALILAISGGGFAALQFAIRYPDRCRALVLLSGHGPATLDFLPNRKILWVFEALVLLDWLVWLIVRLPVKTLLGLEGSPTHRLDTPRKLAIARTFLLNAFPSADWKNGTRNDIEQLFALDDQPAWSLEQIQAPTLILHGERDLVVRPATARRHAEHIPGAKLVMFDDGTHMTFITHHTEISAVLKDFLDRVTPTSPAPESR